jgi:hypothetical protein
MSSPGFRRAMAPVPRGTFPPHEHSTGSMPQRRAFGNCDHRCAAPRLRRARHWEYALLTSRNGIHSRRAREGKEAAMSEERTELEAMNHVIDRLVDIDNSYKALIQKMAKLYLEAEEFKLDDVVKRLDKPMRNASENTQMFEALAKDLTMMRNRMKS